MGRNYLELYVDQSEENLKDCWKVSNSIALVHLLLTNFFEYVIVKQMDLEFDLLILDWLTRSTTVVVVHHPLAMFYTREREESNNIKVTKFSFVCSPTEIVSRENLKMYEFLK